MHPADRYLFQVWSPVLIIAHTKKYCKTAFTPEHECHLVERSAVNPKLLRFLTEHHRNLTTDLEVLMEYLPNLRLDLCAPPCCFHSRRKRAQKSTGARWFLGDSKQMADENWNFSKFQFSAASWKWQWKSTLHWKKRTRDLLRRWGTTNWEGKFLLDLKVDLDVDTYRSKSILVLFCEQFEILQTMRSLFDLFETELFDCQLCRSRWVGT